MQKNNSFFVSINRGDGDGYSVERLLDKKISGGEDITRPQTSSGTLEEKLTINISETDDSLIIQALVPGVRVENIEVFVEDEVLTIKAEASKAELETGTPLYEEHNWKTLSRSVMLPKRVKREGNMADLKNGVLTIRLIKSLPRPPKKLTIINNE